MSINVIFRNSDIEQLKKEIKQKMIQLNQKMNTDFDFDLQMKKDLLELIPYKTAYCHYKEQVSEQRGYNIIYILFPVMFPISLPIYFKTKKYRSIIGQNFKKLNNDFKQKYGVNFIKGKYITKNNINKSELQKEIEKKPKNKDLLDINRFYRTENEYYFEKLIPDKTENFYYILLGEKKINLFRFKEELPFKDKENNTIFEKYLREQEGKFVNKKLVYIKKKIKKTYDKEYHAYKKEIGIKSNFINRDFYRKIFFDDIVDKIYNDKEKIISERVKKIEDKIIEKTIVIENEFYKRGISNEWLDIFEKNDMTDVNYFNEYSRQFLMQICPNQPINQYIKLEKCLQSIYEMKHGKDDEEDSSSNKLIEQLQKEIKDMKQRQKDKENRDRMINTGKTIFKVARKIHENL